MAYPTVATLVGDDSTDDTAALQAAADTAIAAGGKLVIPPPPTAIKLTDTILLDPPAGTDFTLDIEAKGGAAAIKWYGADNKTIFRGVNWHRSKVSGVEISIPSATGVTAWDLDCPTGNTFQVGFENCNVAITGGADSDCTGWRIGHVNTAGGGNSNHQWDNCWVITDGLGADHQGWVWENQQCLLFTWTNCYAAQLAAGWTANPTSGSDPGNGGGGGMVWNGCGAGYNDVDFQTYSPGAFHVNGGRFEQGNIFFDSMGGGGSTSPIAFKVTGIEMADYNPADEIVFAIGRPVSLHLDDCFIWRSGSDHTSDFIKGYGPAGAYGSIRMTGGAIRGVDPIATIDFYPENWKITMDGVIRMDGSQASVGLWGSDLFPPMELAPAVFAHEANHGQ